MKKRLFAVFFAAAVMLLAACGNSAAGTDTTASEGEKTLAPDFTVLDGQGKEIKLSELRGKPVVLNFWASWCGPCKSEMPDFEEAYQQYGGEVHFMMVNLTNGTSETMETAKAFLEGVGYTFPVYFDTASEAAAAYGVSAIPTTYFIDAEGCAVAYGTGAMNLETLLRGLSMIYDGVKTE